jgi:hypothetical protein
MVRWLTSVLVILSILACDDTKIEACSSEDLEWLNNLIDGFDSRTQAPGARIIQYTYQESTVFWVDPCVGCADGLVSVYDCSGEVICELGGIDGRDTCPDFYDQASDPVILFSNNCDDQVIPDSDKYDSETTFFMITAANINGNCLEIVFYSSGCNGESWTWEMVDADLVMESYPVQRNLRLILNNPEFCQAVFTKTAYFDLTPIALKEYNQIKINLSGWDTQLLYKY